METSQTIWFGGRMPDLALINAAGAATLSEHIGIEVVDVGPDWLRARMPVDPRTHQPMGRLHGGASVVLAETIGSVAANACIDNAAFVAVGMEINANHLRPAYSGFVHATATPEALGRTSQVWTIRIADDAGKPVCISRLTMAVIPIARK